MIAGRYTLVSEVGRGGMGVVWRGVDEVLHREVALKRVGMSPGGVSADLARAEREARLLASLNHANVVAVFDLVNDGDEQWLVMEYVENRTLAQLVRERGPLSPDEAAGLLHQAASALAVAHRAGIVHRDVKPSNILVTRTGQVKLSDFGIARAHADATLTQTGLMSGSPAYLAPEVASGHSASAASDVWALGATLYHALTGRPPFEVGDNVMGALYQIVHSEPPRPENAGWLLPLLEATMSKDPAARWSMDQARDFLAKGGETVAAPVPPPTDGEATVILPRGAPAEEAEGRNGRRWLLPLLLVAGAVVLLVGLALWALDPGNGERPGTAADDAEQTEDATPSATEEPPAESPAENPEASAEEMEAFVADYLGTVTSDPDTTWTWLTPGFQDASGGLDDYKGFWSTIESAELLDVEAEPGSMSVSYTVRYTRTDGTVTTDDVTLGLVRKGDRYLIADEA